MTIAAALEVQMFANLARLKADMSEAKNTVSGAMSSIEGAVNKAKSVLALFGVGLGVKMFAEMIQGSIDLMDHLNDLSKTTRISVENLSGLALAAKQSGSDLDSIAASVNKLGVNMGKDGDKFKALGISAKDPLEAFKQLADIMNSLEDPQQRAALGAATLGKKWEGAAPLMAEGGKRIQELIDKGKQLSGITKESAEAADEFNDRLEELKAASEGAKNSFVSSLLPSLTNIIKAVGEAKRESGALAAIWVGLGGIGAAVFTDETLSDAQKMSKTIEELNEQIRRQEQRMKDAADIAGPYGEKTRAMIQAGLELKRAQLASIEKLSAAEKAAGEQKKLQDATKTEAEKKEAERNKARAAAFLNDGAGKKAFDKEFDTLAKAEAQFHGYGESAAYALHLEEEGFKHVSKAQKAVLQDKFDALEAEKKAVEVNRMRFDSDKELITAQQTLMDMQQDYAIALREGNDQMQFENTLIGMSADAMQKANLMRAYELALKQELAKVPEDDTTGAAEKLKATTETAKKRATTLLLENQLLTDQKKRWDNLATSAGQYFGKFGEGIVKITKLLYDMGEQEQEIARKREDAAKIEDPEKRAKAELMINRQATVEKLQSFGDLADAASGFFDKQSRGYKALQAVSQVFHAAQVAMNLVEMGQKAIIAVLNQANGDPYTAFVRMAAMAAVVAGLGVAIGGGGSGGVQVSSADRQKVAGTGSVLGDTKAKSQSLNDSLEMLAKNSIIGNEHTDGMLRYLRSIDSNIGGLANLVARASGLTGADTGSLGLGTSSNMPAWAGVLTGSAGGKIGSILSGGLTNVVGAIFGSLFGKTTKTLLDSGLLLNSQSVGQARAGVSASQYADVQTNSSSFFGLIKNSSTSRETTALSGEITTQFTMIVNQLFNSILSAAKVFGSDGGAISKVLDAFQINMQSISFKDLTGDEIEKQLRAIFSKLGDDMASAAFDGLSKFQNIGEGTYETLMRLAQEFAATDEIAKLLGKDVTKAFGAIGFAGIEARDKLVKLFGGIQEMSDAVSKYVDLYYTDAEKLGRQSSNLKDQFAELGLAVPKTMEEYRKLVEAQDLSTESGRSLFAALIQLAPSFATIANAAKKAKDDIFSAANSISGGKLGAAMAKAEEQAAAADWNALWKKLTGQDGSISGTIGNVHKYSADPTMLAGMIEAAYQQGGQPAVDALKRLWIAVDENTKATDTNTEMVYGSSEWYAANLAAGYIHAAAHDATGLASYLQGTLQSAASPLTLQAKYAAAKQAYDANLALTGDSGTIGQNALNNFGGLRDAFLAASSALYASSGQYNQDFFSTFNQGASLTMGLVRPYTAQDAITQTDRLMAAVTEGTATSQKVAMAVIDVGNAVIANARDNTAETNVKLQETVDVLVAISGRGGAMVSNGQEL